MKKLKLAVLLFFLAFSPLSVMAASVNLNTASAAELEALPGIGATKAAAIVQDRESNGPYASVDDLVRVSGIGEKTVDGLRKDVTVK